jgi:hypothetical protein
VVLVNVTKIQIMKAVGGGFGFVRRRRMQNAIDRCRCRTGDRRHTEDENRG